MPTLSLHNPATGALITTVPADDAASVAAKAAAARAAQPPWAATPIAQRLEAIGRFRAAVVAQLETLAADLTAETGKPITLARNELNGLLPRLDFFVEEAEAAVRDEPVFDGGGMHETIGHIPLGVVLNISAWNYPWFVGCNVIVPALLTGNAVLYKPSEYAVLTGRHITRLLHESGVPAEVMQCLVGGGEVGAAALAQRIDGVFFTGSHATGVKIAQAVAHRMVKLQLELGGKDPAYVRADADLEHAAANLVDGSYFNSGQSCCGIERIYVDRALYPAFVERFTQLTCEYVLGNPLEEATTLGPLVKPEAAEFVRGQIVEALARGARALVDPHRFPRDAPGSAYMAPQVLVDVDHGMAVMREESFGPVVGIMPVDSEPQAIALMNDSPYGLTASIWTRDVERAAAIGDEIATGTVFMNRCDYLDPALAWTGVKDTGRGATLSRVGYETLTRPKSYHLRTQT